MSKKNPSVQSRFLRTDKREGNGILLTATPLIDIVELEDGRCLYCNLPGVAPGEVEVTVDKEHLHIRAAARLTPFKGKIHALEFNDILYEGKVRIPAVDSSRVEASLVNGLLRVFIPFPSLSTPVRIPVLAG